MKPETFFTGRPIRSLQTMLRVLGESKGREVTLIPDGIYGPQTMAAVTDFQRQLKWLRLKKDKNLLKTPRFGYRCVLNG